VSYHRDQQMRKSLLLLLGALLILAAATAAGIYWDNDRTVDHAVRALKERVANRFGDPESVRFRSLRLESDQGLVSTRLRSIQARFLWDSTPERALSALRYDPTKLHLCGEVNAKNAFGADAGYKWFWASGGSDKDVAFSERAELCDVPAERLVYRGPSSE
jgi:hypothetical protein